jgi:hypothetical protein
MEAPMNACPNPTRVEASLQAIRRRLEAAACAAVIGASAARHEGADLKLYHGLSVIGDRLVEELARLDELIHNQTYKASRSREAP